MSSHVLILQRKPAKVVSPQSRWNSGTILGEVLDAKTLKESVALAVFDSNGGGNVILEPNEAQLDSGIGSALDDTVTAATAGGFSLGYDPRDPVQREHRAVSDRLFLSLAVEVSFYIRPPSRGQPAEAWDCRCC